MGAVVPIAPTSRVDEAWDEFQHFARRLTVSGNQLLHDRQFMESYTRAHERWRVLFLMAERDR